jgi:hypothetical protein
MLSLQGFSSNHCEVLVSVAWRAMLDCETVFNFTAVLLKYCVSGVEIFKCPPTAQVFFKYPVFSRVN